MPNEEDVSLEYFKTPGLQKWQITGGALQYVRVFINESLIENHYFEPIRKYSYINRKRKK